MSDEGLLSPVHCFPFHCFPLRVGTMGTMEAMQAGGLNVPPAGLLLPMLPGTVGSNGNDGNDGSNGACPRASRLSLVRWPRLPADARRTARDAAQNGLQGRAAPPKAPTPRRGSFPGAPSVRVIRTPR